MAYTPTVFVDNISPPITAAELNKIGGGIQAVAVVTDKLNPSSTTAGLVLVADGTQFTPRALLSTDIPGIVTNAQSGTTYTLVLADAGKLVELSNASAVTLTVPPNSSVAFAIGTIVSVRQYGAGQVTLTAGSGVTLRSRGGAYKTAGQYAEAAMTKRGTDEWVCAGDLAV